MKKNVLNNFIRKSAPIILFVGMILNSNVANAQKQTVEKKKVPESTRDSVTKDNLKSSFAAGTKVILPDHSIYIMPEIMDYNEFIEMYTKMQAIINMDLSAKRDSIIDQKIKQDILTR